MVHISHNGFFVIKNSYKNADCPHSNALKMDFWLQTYQNPIDTRSKHEKVVWDNVVTRPSNYSVVL